MSDVKDYLVGGSGAFADFLERLGRLAASEATVLLVGESGSGKGAAARALHAAGPRSSGPFVTVSVAALPATLVESELFGHERGAFTDAHRAREGSFRRAGGGTVVLDDVELLPPPVQAALLRVLQEREVEPVGGEGPVPVDVRVVATTQRDLAAEVEAGRFRGDLYYRLAVVTIEVPPLRARLDDLPALAERLLSGLVESTRAAPRPLSDGALSRLAQHSWPGNVRELENALERVLVLPPPGPGGQLIAPEELDFLTEARGGAASELAQQALAQGLSVDDVALAMMTRALEEQRGNVSAAARQVGLTRRAFEYRLARADEPEEGGAESDGGGAERRPLAPSTQRPANGGRP